MAKNISITPTRQKKQIIDAIASLPSEINLPFLLNVGGDHYIMTQRIIGVFDIAAPAIKKIIKDLSLDKPRNIINVTGSKRQKTAIFLVGEIVIISPFERLTLIKRLLTVDVKESLKPNASYKSITESFAEQMKSSREIPDDWVPPSTAVEVDLDE